MSDANIGIRCNECGDILYIGKDVSCKSFAVSPSLSVEKLDAWLNDHTGCCFDMNPKRGAPYPFEFFAEDR